MSSMSTDELEQLARSWGADLVGVAAAERLSQSPGYTPFDLLPGASSVVVMGRRVFRSSLREGRGRSVAYLLTHLNIKLNEVAYNVSRFLEDSGYEALPVLFPSLMLYPLKAREFPKEFSYKHAAVAAGLGSFGLSRLLITPQFGPRVRLVAVITDAPIKPDEPFEGQICDKEGCGYRCVDACPSGAISKSGELDWDKCVSQLWKYLHILGYAYCARCMAVCPVGK